MKRFAVLRQEEIASNICGGDCCIGAVRRSYSEMCSSGAPEAAALDAALAVFRWHHPEVMADSAVTLVRGWVQSSFKAVH